MAIPDYQSIMLPLLKLTGDKKEHSLHEVESSLAKSFSMSENDLQRVLPSGRQSVFHNRVGWARTYLAKAGLLQATKRGYFKITNRGLDILSQNLTRIDNKILKQFPEFLEFQNRKNKSTLKAQNQHSEQDGNTPEESLQIAYQTIRTNLAAEILEKVRSCSPNFFERLVVELLVKMGYGGTLQDAAGEVLGKSGDGGVDGLIKEDRLGLDVIYLQAKRWENIVGSSSIRDFAGALLQKKARKGVFITTSNFTESAKTFVRDIESTGSKIVLIDGNALSDLMIDYNVGVSIAETYEIKRIDSDYFIEE